ncbi:uncharacterized protein LOC118438860 isoform X1 [Folsomia candida]|uniref:uncharacterized protein LOC118438860 isoform X1 n=1 Tax=Folsomia candida TaxID=158441 RepID=UPI00160526B9|nr:uncharacterized protein LOC118438860 isoform X1 [Folsomia candida]
MCPLDMGTESVEVMEAERIIIPVNDLAIMLTNTTGQHSLIVYNRELHQVRLEKIEDAPPPPHQIEIIMQSPATEGQAVNSDVRDPNLTTSERDTLFLTTCVKQLSSAPNEMLTVQPLTSSVVSEAIKEAQEAAVQAAVQASPPPQTPPPVNERKIKKVVI